MPDGSLNETTTPRLGSGPPDVSISFPATELGVRRAMTTFHAGMRAHDLDAMSMGTAELVLVEACNNIVEHAYANSGKGTVNLTARHENGLLLIELSDAGLPMPGLMPPNKKNHDLDSPLEDLPEGGFGWGLIRDLTTSLAYRRVGARNVLRCSIEMQPSTD